jgi:hypothetical protein
MPSLPIHVLQGTPKEATAYVCQIRAMRRASAGVRNSLDNALLKQAYSWNEFTKGLSNSDPLSYGLAGAGGGALIATLNELRRKKKQRNYSNILLGAGIGGGIGAGGAYLNKQLDPAGMVDRANIGGTTAPSPDTNKKKPEKLDETTPLGTNPVTGNPVPGLNEGDVTEVSPAPPLEFAPSRKGENGEVIPGREISDSSVRELPDPWLDGALTERGDDPVSWLGNALLSPGEAVLQGANLAARSANDSDYEGQFNDFYGTDIQVPEVPVDSPGLRGTIASAIGGGVRRKAVKHLNKAEQGVADLVSHESIMSSAPDVYVDQAVNHTPKKSVPIGGPITSKAHRKAVKNWLTTAPPDEVIAVLTGAPEAPTQITDALGNKHAMNIDIAKNMLGGHQMTVPVTGQAAKDIPQPHKYIPLRDGTPLVPAQQVQGQFDSIFSGDVKKPSRAATQHAQGLGRKKFINKVLGSKGSKLLASLPFGIGAIAEIVEQLNTRGK